jgi:phosphodiester glycosidase
MGGSVRYLSVLCIGILLLAPEPGLADSPRFWSAVRFSSGFTVPVVPGVSYSHFTVATSIGPLSIHHLRLDLSRRAVRLGVGLAHNQIISADETVSSMARRSGAVAGVNGDYFDIGDSGMPLNIVVKDGRLLRSPSGRMALAIGKDRSVQIARYRWAGSVVFPATRQSYWLAGFNTGLVHNAIVALSNDRGYGAPVPGPGTRQTVVELAPEEESRGAFVIPSTQAAGPFSRHKRTLYTIKRVWRQEAYHAPFPMGVILLVGRGTAAAWLLRNVTAGMRVEVNLATDPDWRGLAGVIGGGPLLVRGRQIVDDLYSPAPNERDHRHPVSAVGISRDGRTMVLVAIDGRQPRLSIGLTRPQLAAYMRSLGAYQAMAFDSGGSVTMVVRLPGHSAPTVVNSPSDGRERRVADALLVFSASTKNAMRSNTGR